MKRAIILAALLLAGCDMSKQAVDSAEQQCLKLGGEPDYRFSNNNPRTVYRVYCRVKTMDGDVYSVRVTGRGISQ